MAVTQLADESGQTLKKLLLAFRHAAQDSTATAQIQAMEGIYPQRVITLALAVLHGDGQSCPSSPGAPHNPAVSDCVSSDA
jgi:hypothetical protein